jgi:hypothetical protein
MNKDPQAKPDPRDAVAGQGKPDRLDSIEAADDRTGRLDPGRAGTTSDPVEDMLDAGQSNAEYEEEARRVAPVPGPSDQADG